jgi:hypothetical protein
MKKLKFEIVVLCLVTLFTLVYSCKKVLNQPVSGYLTGAVLANKAGVDGLLIGAYAVLDGYYQNQPGTNYGSGISNWSYGGVGADDAYKGSTTSDQGGATLMTGIEQHAGISTFNSYLESKWQVNYAGIQRANNVIQEVPLVKDGSEPTTTGGAGAEAIAEARFLRGVYHFELAKIWKNVPYVNETITYAAGNFDVPNPGPIWTDIEADFTAAAAVLPETQPQVGRANKWAAEAFLAKALLYDHQYASALTVLNTVISSGKTASGAPYALGPYQNNFNAIYRNSPEAVFQAQFTVNDGSSGQNDDSGDVLNFPGGGTYTSCCGFDVPSYNMANAFQVDLNGLPMFKASSAGYPMYDVANLPNDHNCTSTISKKWNPTGEYGLFTIPSTGDTTAFTVFVAPTTAVDPRLDWTVGRRNIPYLDWGLGGGEPWTRGDLVPYTPKKNVFYEANVSTTADNYGTWATNQGSADNYNIIRFADVILWRAECEVMTGALAAAQTDVNTIRMRAMNKTSWVYNYADNTNPQGGYSITPAANYVVGLYGKAAGTDFVTMGQALSLEAVMMERQLEFGEEGQRFFDLQRQDAASGSGGPTFAPFGVGYMAGVLNAYYAADNRIPNPVLSAAKFTSGRDELWPIPQTEIQNEQGKLKQNPNY